MIKTCNPLTSLYIAFLCGVLFHSPGVAADPEKRNETSGDPVPLSSLRERVESDIVRLYDEEDRGLDVQLLSLVGEYISIRRASDGKVFDLPLAKLNDASRDYVYKWVEATPQAVDYSLGIEVTKRMDLDDKYETAGRTLKTSKVRYDVVVTNRTRNPLSGAIVEYRIIYDDDVSFLRSTAYPGKGEQWDGEAADLPDMDFNGRVEFTTPAVEIDSYEYKPSRGEREYRKDKIVGIWVRLIKQGVILSEYKSNEQAMGSLVWDGEDEEGIVFKDTFKESFE